MFIKTHRTKVKIHFYHVKNSFQSYLIIHPPSYSNFSLQYSGFTLWAFESVLGTSKSKRLKGQNSSSRLDTEKNLECTKHCTAIDSRGVSHAAKLGNSESQKQRRSQLFTIREGRQEARRDSQVDASWGRICGVELCASARRLCL